MSQRGLYPRYKDSDLLPNYIEKELEDDRESD